MKKILITKVGGEKCFLRNSLVNHTGRNYCLKDLQPCDEQRCQNCPHGITISEAADKMLRFSLLGKDFDYTDLPAQRQQREEELEYLLEVQNGKKQN